MIPLLQYNHMDRRSFITSGLVAAGTATLLHDAAAEEPRVSSPGIEGYRLPSFKKGCRIVFQGDSITDMNRGRNENDRNHYLGHGYAFLIAARLGVDMAEAQLNIYNRGISGHTVGDLRKRWQKDAIDMKPDLLSILIGTNDVHQGVTEDAFENDYRYILDSSREANPELRLVLLDPFVLRSGDLAQQEAWTTRRAATDRLRTVVGRLAEDYNAVHVKTQDVFDSAAKASSPEQWIWDGVHPLPQGQELIARKWLEEVSRRWPHA